MTVTLTDGTRHPKIYAYTIPTYAETEWQGGGREGKGLLKVGYTDRDIAVRVKEQLHAVKMPGSTPYSLVVAESAMTDDGRTFRDSDVHKELVRAGVQRVNGEWFECTSDEVLAAIQSVKAGAKLSNLQTTLCFGMRPEQELAVEQTAQYFTTHADSGNPPQFLWNAKMRFGKTFTTYQLAKRLGWTRLLVLTYKPAAERAWREDLERHTDFQGWRFKGKDDPLPDPDDPAPLVWFASFQDVLGTDEDGQPKVKNEDLHLIDWDCLAVDEYHFGAWREAARTLYIKDAESGTTGDASESQVVDTPDLEDSFRENLTKSLTISIANYLYLSGTPFRALTEGEFLEDQVFNWTYGDEQKAKAEWDVQEGENPYLALPKMTLLTYEMPDKLREVALNNQSEFSLTEFYKTKKDEHKKDVFVHEQSVQKWLDLLRGQDLSGLWASVSTQNRPPLPYEDMNLLQALQHTVWYLPNVSACHAMRDLLTAQQNTFFHDYTVVVAAGAKAGLGEQALPPVSRAIGHVPQDSKTITLTCGKLMTGVTVPAWAGILMLRELKSPESYFQASFRVQSPWTSTFLNTVEGGESRVVHKEQCYVIDFAPNRALRQIVDYATRLRADVASERDDEEAIAEFLEFLPVLSFDGYSMGQLEPSDVISYLLRNTTSSMLARRWNSPELLTLDLKAMETLLANPALLASLEKIEAFRNITQDLTAMVTTNKELSKKKVARDPLTDEEKEKDEKAKSTRENLKKRLQHFVARIPAFMYLTDDRERNLKDIITQLEPGLFQRVTGLTLSDFQQLVDAGVFNDSKMNDAVWKFRTFEEPSLSYTGNQTPASVIGGWTVSRDPRFANLIASETLRHGDVLYSPGRITKAVITDDDGLLVNGTRYDTPDLAMQAVAGGSATDGWEY